MKPPLFVFLLVLPWAFALAVPSIIEESAILDLDGVLFYSIIMNFNSGC